MEHPHISLPGKTEIYPFGPLPIFVSFGWGNSRLAALVRSRPHISAPWQLHSIQRPPVVKDLAVAVSFWREVWVRPHLFAAHPLEPALALAVFRIFDVLARVQEGLSLKALVHVSPVGRITGKPGDGQPAV